MQGLPTNDRGEVVVRLGSCPPETKSSDLGRQFSMYGSITHINVRRENKGSIWYVAFLPIKAGPFWDRLERGPTVKKIMVGNSPVEFTINMQLVIPFQDVDTAMTRRQRAPRSNLFPIMLEFGILTGERQMTVMRSLPATREGSLMISVDLGAKRLDMKFSYVVPPPSHIEEVPQHLNIENHFKGEITFTNISKIHMTQEPSGTQSLIIITETPSRFFRKRRNLQTTYASRDYWTEHEAFQRITHIMFESNGLEGTSTALVAEDQDIDLGRWLVYRILLPESDQDSWGNLRENIEDWNVPVDASSSFEVVPPRDFDLWDFLNHQHITKNSMLAVLDGSTADYHVPFAVRYQLEVCISHGLLSEQNITPEFIGKLAELSRQKRYLSNPAADILMYVADIGRKIYDPLSIFSDRRALTYRPIFQLPDYCQWGRKVVVTPTTMHINSPTPETTNRVLRQYEKYGDRFLRVQFTDEKQYGKIYGEDNRRRNTAIFNRVYRTLKNGLDLAGRHYEFLAFGNSQFREHGAYFFHPANDLTCDHIRAWMGEFNHIKVVAKFAARMGQCLSTTRSVQNLPAGNHIREIPDVKNNDWCFTDGVGKISTTLAGHVADSLNMWNRGQTPSAFQFRLGGSKGMLAVWPRSVTGPDESALPPLEFNHVHIRPSQKKFNTDYAKGIEIVRGAEYSVATLNRQTIPILSSLQVSDDVFMDMAKEQDQEYRSALGDESTALDLLKRHSDQNNTNEMLLAMVESGFMRTEEPCVMALLRMWVAWSQKQLKEKARIVVDQGAFLFGCADESHKLRGWSRKSNDLPQIFLQVPESTDSSQYVIKTGFCVVGRNPSMHPGDIRVVEAVDLPELRHLRDVVVFPVRGERDVPSMCSGGDLDGDEFFVFWDQRLLPPKAQRNILPMDHDEDTKPKVLNRDVEMSDIHDFFVEHIAHDCVGLIATSHMAAVDLFGARDHRSLKLAKLHSKAVDYVKTGHPAELPASLVVKKWPHFMERKRNSYKSKTVLGQIYDMVKNLEIALDYDRRFDSRIIQRYDPTWDELMKARALKTQYDSMVTKIMRQHDIEHELELFTTFVLNKSKVANNYTRGENIGIIRDALHERFIRAAILAAGPREGEKFKRLAAACYRVTWEDVQQAEEEEQAFKPYITFPWVFHRELCQIASPSGRKKQAGRSEPELGSWPEVSKVWDADISGALEGLLHIFNDRHKPARHISDARDEDILEEDYTMKADGDGLVLNVDEETMEKRQEAARKHMQALRESMA